MLIFGSSNNLLPDAVDNVYFSGRLHLTAAQGFRVLSSDITISEEDLI